MFFLGNGKEVCGERPFQGIWTEMKGQKWDGSFSIFVVVVVVVVVVVK